jgi:hypothetical protein
MIPQMRKSSQPMNFFSRRANLVPVEILCISCAAFAVWFAIFFLPRAATFMDNRSSSVIHAMLL